MISYIRCLIQGSVGSSRTPHPIQQDSSLFGQGSQRTSPHALFSCPCPRLSSRKSPQTMSHPLHCPTAHSTPATSRSRDPLGNWNCSVSWPSLSRRKIPPQPVPPWTERPFLSYPSMLMAPHFLPGATLDPPSRHECSIPSAHVFSGHSNSSPSTST